MSIESTTRDINIVDRELADLEKKLSTETVNEASKQKKIFEVNRSISRTNAPNQIQSYQRQIENYQRELVNITGKKAEISKKIADKRKKRADMSVKLQAEETNEKKKQDTQQKAIQKNYEKRISELTSLLSSREKVTVFNHIYAENKTEQYDVFISHASEDKESFVDDLVKELEYKNIKVWYDAINILWGDSLRSKIDNGLKNSTYGIVVISRDFINKGWTQYELDGLFNIEMVNGKTILPIWHNISKKEVHEFSPTLAGKKALSSTQFTALEIANELVEILNINNTFTNAQ